MNNHLKILLFVLLTLAYLLIAGCSTDSQLIRNPAPESEDKRVAIAGIPDARFWGDDVPIRVYERLLGRPREEVRADYPAMFDKPHNYLAISGGGADGAFGAGLLVGWTEAGDRPEFQIVTGVSTGALMAPWAFLGSRYDDTLEEIYTTISTKNILRSRWLISILFRESAVDSKPMLKMIKRYVSDEVIRAIAEEHKKGRRLFIGTTSIDHMRSMIWDIGAIASSGRPEAKDLIHRIMLASASIPGAFPPVKIYVEADGVKYDELHVDGGTTNQVFVYPSTLNWGDYLKILEVPGKVNIYVIRNSQVQARRVIVKQSILPIAKQSISSLIRTQGIGDVNLIYMQSRRDNAEFRLAVIPTDFEEEAEEVFDKKYMNKLFDLGRGLSREGYPWLDKPTSWIE
ncbi:MAG: hypothetical protein ACI9MF_002267 [Gammaproteobacteria bacterium]|jgi:hypothetical protein